MAWCSSMESPRDTGRPHRSGPLLPPQARVSLRGDLGRMARYPAAWGPPSPRERAWGRHLSGRGGRHRTRQATRFESNSHPVFGPAIETRLQCLAQLPRVASLAPSSEGN